MRQHNPSSRILIFLCLQVVADNIIHDVLSAVLKSSREKKVSLEEINDRGCLQAHIQNKPGNQIRESYSDKKLYFVFIIYYHYHSLLGMTFRESREHLRVDQTVTTLEEYQALRANEIIAASKKQFSNFDKVVLELLEINKEHSEVGYLFY